MLIKIVLPSTLLEPQSRFGDKQVKFRVVCPRNGTAVLKGLIDTDPGPQIMLWLFPDKITVGLSTLSLDCFCLHHGRPWWRTASSSLFITQYTPSNHSFVSSSITPLLHSCIRSFVHSFMHAVIMMIFGLHSDLNRITVNTAVVQQ